MFISVRILYENGKRLSAYSIKAQMPVSGYLSLGKDSMSGYTKARLLDESGREILGELVHARVVECRGKLGMLIEGTHYRRKGRKDAYPDKQQWWCQAPPETKPILDHAARVDQMTQEYFARQDKLYR